MCIELAPCRHSRNVPFSSPPPNSRALVIFPFHLWLGILCDPGTRNLAPLNMAVIQHLPCLLSPSSSDPMGMENFRLLHGSLWKIPNWSFFEKGDITSELPHVAIMEFLFMWMDIFTRYWKMLKLNSKSKKGQLI